MLWQKESHRENAMFVDLLDAPSVDKMFTNCQTVFERGLDFYGRNASSALFFREQGNEHFAKKNWFTAMMFYNKSLCCSEAGSETMGLAYGNRASCFFNMKMYAKCLIDIENARQNNYPVEKMTKLDERQANCLAMMEKETDQSDVFEPKLDYVPNEMFPCLADVLVIENNRKYGRHIVAKEDIDVGKTVMVDQFYFAETFKQKFARCGNCLKLGENLKPCNKCTFTMHCLRCEGNSFHDIECSINQGHILTSEFYSFRMVIIRSILLAMNAFNDVDELITAVEEMLSSDEAKTPESLFDPQSKYRAFFQLLLKPKEHVGENLSQKVYVIHRLIEGAPSMGSFFNSKAHKRFLLHLIAHHVLTIENFMQTDHMINDKFGEDIEVFSEHRMSIAASYFNHSCAPNVQIAPQNGLMTCIVLRPVRKGEQLCMAYDCELLLKSKSERQEHLRSKFKFHQKCNCDRCERPGLESSCLKPSARIQLDPYYRSLFEMDVAKIINGPYFQNILAMKANIIRLLKKYGNAAWSDELLRMIVVSYGITIVERRSGPHVPYMSLLYPGHS